MNNKILNHYLQFSCFTNPGCHKDSLKKVLPDDIKKIGLLVRKQIIHSATLKNGNVGTNKDLRYGDITKVPWYRQCEDDNFPTASAMLAELYRRDNRGLVLKRAEKDRLILTCRFVAILMAAILKAKSIPCRVRSGFAPYFNFLNGKSVDHWINQYWDKKERRWKTIDVDGSLEDYIEFDSYDIPNGVFDFSADAWIKVRKGLVNGKHFYNAGGFEGLMTIAWEIFYDFHCLMNNEIIYYHHPAMAMLNTFLKLKEQQLKEIDELAYLMQNPDNNFEKLKQIYETNKQFRLLKGGLL